MIKELLWDSDFFKKKIGELIITSPEPSHIGAAVNKAEADGFKYLICKIQPHQTAHVRLLESLNFYLSDIGVTWIVETDRFLYKNKDKNPEIGRSIVVALDKDIPELKEISKSLFIESRFYNDPFFSKEEADNLYQAWIENSVKGKVADLVLFIPDMGFVTCRKSEGSVGQIVLIGIRRGFRNQGAGAMLVVEAVKFFRKEGIRSVTVRTQLKNISAMNFYLKRGFYIKGSDLVYGRII